MKKRAPRGMTLLEIMVAAVLTAAVMAVAMSVVGTGVRVARQNEQTATSNDSARMAAEAVVRDLRAVGFTRGLLVTNGATTVRINPVFTTANTSNAALDDLWLVVPRANMMQADCAKVGSAAVVGFPTNSGPLSMKCTTSLVGATTLVVTDLSRGVLINMTASTATSVTFTEQAVPNFYTAPEKGSFLRGDLVVPVDIVRYSVQNNAITGRPELQRHLGRIATAGFGAAMPFEIDPARRTERFGEVEDLQIAFGSGGTTLTFASGHGALYSPATVPLAVRVNIVGISERQILTEKGTLMPLGPVTVEDHVAAAVVDGYRRSIYKRRIEMLNMGNANL